MTVLNEFKALTPLRKNQQIMAFYLLFVNAMLISIAATFYIALFGGEGLLLKDYGMSLYGLILFIPFIGRFAMSQPLVTFKFALVLEAFSVVGYFLVSQDVMAQWLLPLATLFIVSSNILMRPILIQVDSIVTAGCGTYSLLKSKLDALYTAFGALFGGAFVILGMPPSATITIFAASLFMARLYRKRVLDEVYGKTTLQVA